MTRDPRLAVLSDAHGNIEALNRVLEDMDGLGLFRAVFLGDAIGYGPEPEASARALLDRDIPMVLGNHEKGVADKHSRMWFNPQAYKSLEKTRSLLTSDTEARLAALPASLVLDDMRFVHGTPPDSVTRYLFELDDDQLRDCFASYPERLCFAGHTHELMRYTLCPDGSLERMPLARGVVGLDPEARHIINAGSVGQPRDGNNNAKYVVYDRDKDSIEVRYVPYDIKKTADRIIELGMPRAYADRLW